MPQYVASTPTVVYRQASAPTGVNDGDLWYDTDDHAIYFRNNSAWVQISSAQDAQGLETAILQNAIEILRLTADASLSSADYENMYVDIVSDASGTDNTIDTSGTTAFFSTNKYINEIDFAHGITVGNDQVNRTAKGGIKFLVGASGVSVVSITKKTECTATTAYVLDASKSVVATKAFTGNTATFDTPYACTAATAYYLACDSGGANYTRSYSNSTSFPISRNTISYTSGFGEGIDGDAINNILDAVLTPSKVDLVVKTNAQALGFAPVYALVFCKDTLVGTGSVTWDISYDGGSTQDSTDNALNVKVAAVDSSAKNMIITINLNAGASAGTASIENYAVMLWSS